jgi:hypothetical protein
MKRSGVCPKCQSNQIVRDARIGDHEGALQVWTYQNPDALVFTGKVRSNVMACVCSVCGFMELYAEKASLLPRAKRTVASARPAAPKRPPAAPTGKPLPKLPAGKLPKPAPKKLPKPPPGSLPKPPDAKPS